MRAIGHTGLDGFGAGSGSLCDIGVAIFDPVVRRLRRHIALPVVVDMGFRMGDRRVRIGPCKADFERRKRHAIDDDRREIGSLNPGVP